LHVLFLPQRAIFFKFFILFNLKTYLAELDLVKPCCTFIFVRKVMHDDVKSGKSVPHWQGDFLSLSLSETRLFDDGWPNRPGQYLLAFSFRTKISHG
jgi:hypothetical protein